QFCGVGAKPVGIGPGPSSVDPHVTVIGPTQFLQPLQQSSESGLSLRIFRGQIHKNADPSHPFGLRAAQCNWPRNCRAADQGEDLPPLHSITSPPPGPNTLEPSPAADAD